jgi:AAHS family 4-hydroxybenzoate transporter-like MFS transporter
VLLGATLAFACFTLLTAFTATVQQMLAVRFLAGLGLGAIMPNATALVGEYSPSRRRIATMMIVTNGFMVGAVLGGVASAWLIPEYGWRSVFYVGGIVPLAIVAAMHRWLPESLQFLAVRGRGQERIARWASRVGPAVGGVAVEYVGSEERRRGGTLVQLFRAERGAGTALLWAVSFLNVLNAFFVASWVPTIVRDAGHSTSAAVLVGTTVQIGGALGTFVLGALARKVGIIALLTACFGGAAMGLAAIGLPGLPFPVLVAVAFVVGWGIFGGQPGLNALAATHYPTDLRSTGIGAMLGVGRIGAVLGPLAASALMARGWSDEALFLAAALPAALAAALVLELHRVMRPRVSPRGADPTGRPRPRTTGAS